MNSLFIQKIICYLMILFNILCIIFPQYVRGNFSVTNWDDPSTDYNNPDRKRNIRIIHSIILIVLLFITYHMFWKVKNI